MAALFQFVYIEGTYMTLKEATRGMFVLEEAGAFTIPVTVEIDHLVHDEHSDTYGCSVKQV